MQFKYLIFLFLFGSLTVISQEDEFENMPYVLGDVLVLVDDNESVESIISLHQELEGEVTELKIEKVISKPANIWLLRFNHNNVTHTEMLNDLRLDPHVLLVQNNHLVTERLAPNDSNYGSQWHHDDGVTDNDIDSELAWDITTGGVTANNDTIVVCVLEGGGSDWSHPDLIDNHWVNSNEIPNNQIDDDNNGYVDDYNGWNVGASNDNINGGGHGTSVSGMIGATGNNTSQVAGANWAVKIMQVDMPFGLTEANVINSYTYPLVMRQLYSSSNGASGAFVVATNASWGIDNGDPASAPLWCAFYDTLGYYGILNFGATANNNVNIDVVGDLPTGCGSDYMVSVTATNNADVRTFSGYGQTTIDLGAPGEDVVTTTNGGGFGATSGTSFATPLTAGVCALMYSVPCTNLADLSMQDPQAAADIIRAAILDGVDQVPNLATETVTGGRLNAFNSCSIIQTDCGTYGCNAVFSANIAEELSCPGACDGEITMSGMGGSGTYTYDIGNGPQTDSVFSGLCSGTYSIIADDGANCTSEVEVTINEPGSMSYSSTSSAETFGNDGAIDLTVNGGVPPYTYQWMGPGNVNFDVEDPAGLAGGIYTVTVTDSNGCVIMSEDIEVPSVLNMDQKDFGFKIYPNPANDILSVQLINIELGVLLIYDELGKVVEKYDLSTPYHQMDISGLAGGVYTVKLVSSNNHSLIKKMIVLD